jgi:excisionase family DNA binding protein
MEPLAVDLSTAARVLSVSVRTVRRHVRTGHLPSLRLGRRVLIPVAALKDICAANVGSNGKRALNQSTMTVQEQHDGTT